MADNGNGGGTAAAAPTADDIVAREAMEDMTNAPMGPGEATDTYPEGNSAPLGPRQTPGTVNAPPPNIAAQPPDTSKTPSIADGASAEIMKPKTPSSVWRGLLAGALTGLAGASRDAKPGNPLSGAGAGINAEMQQNQRRQEIARQQKQQEFANKMETDEAAQRKMLNQAQIAASNASVMHTQQLIHQSDVETRGQLANMAKEQLQPMIDSGGTVLATGITSDQINDMIQKGQLNPSTHTAYQDGETEVIGADGKPVAFIQQSGEEAVPGQTQKRATYTVVSVPPEVTVTPAFAAQAAKYGYKLPEGTVMDGVAFHNLSTRLQAQATVDANLAKVKAETAAENAEAAKSKAGTRLTDAQLAQLGAGLGGFANVDPSSPAAQSAKAAFAPYLTAASKKTGKDASDPATVQEAVNQFALNPKTRGMVGVIAAQAGVLPNGDAFLATLPPQRATLVKAVTQYKAPLNQVTSYRGNEREVLAEQAFQADPHFDMKEYATRQKLLQDFTSGYDSKTVASLNMATQHLAVYHRAALELANGNVNVANAALNELARQMGNPKLANFEAARLALGEELATTFKGSAGTEGQTQEYQRLMTPNQSPAYYQKQAETIVEQLTARMDTFNQKFVNGMGIADDPAAGKSYGVQILMPRSASALKSIEGDNANDLLRSAGYDPTKVQPLFGPPAPRAGIISRMFGGKGNSAPPPARPQGVPPNAVWNAGANQWQLPQTPPRVQ